MNIAKAMNYIDAGAGYPILMGHSYLFDKEMWAPQIKTLSENFRLIVPDLWGHGESPALPKRTGSLTDLAYDHLQLMDRLEIEEFAIVGLSVGGMWGAELAVLAPKRVKALMLFDTYLGSEDIEVKNNYFNMLMAVKAAGKIPPPLVSYIVSQFYSAHASNKDKTALIKYLSSLPSATLRESIVPLGKLIFGRPDRLSILDRIKCPVHIATGEFDLPRPPEESQMMARWSGHKFTPIPHAGHISNRENPQFVTTLIKDFINKNTADSSLHVRPEAG